MKCIIIGAISFLALLGIDAAYGHELPSFTIEKRDCLAEILLDTAAEVTCFKKGLPLLKAPEEALTLSRFEKDGKIHTMAVLKDDGDRVEGIDLSAELNRYDNQAFEIIETMSFDQVVARIRTSDNKVSVAYGMLLPCINGDKHLAIGINYTAHGEETGQVQPFMFPKFVNTDPASHTLTYTEGWLLDHEVELGIVFPKPICSVSDLDKLLIGFLVVNDFTDRATLMRKMDSKNVIGGKGFPDAKSKPGFLPTGPYLVIPKDWRKFVKELNLSLSVNGEQRQNGDARDMVWDIENIVMHSLAVKGERKSYYREGMVPLFEGQCIPANSIVITGTPAGVVFNAPKSRFIFGTVMKYIFTGRFFVHKMHPYILKEYLKKEQHNPRYLKPGDVVVTSISYLGSIQTKVTGP